jgi:PAS domain S-box-containing protein
MTEDRHVLDVLFKHAREAVTVQDQSGGLVYANDRAAAMLGFESGEEMVAAPPAFFSDFEMIDESGSSLSFEVLPGRRVLSGEDSPEITIGYRKPGSRRVRWSRVNASPIKNDAGEVVWAINFFFDITDQVRRQEGDALLARISDALGKALDVEQNLLAIADVLVPEYASWCALHVAPVEGGPVSWAIKNAGAGEQLRYVVIDQHNDRIEEDQLQHEVIRTGKPRLVTDNLAKGQGRRLLSSVDGWPEPVVETRSVACVPLGPSARVGSLTVARGRDDDALDEFDLALLVDIGERAGVALANARAYQQEHETARALQSGLMPTHIPDIPGVTFVARYQPLAMLGHVGGDFYDIVELAPDRCAIAIGDIEGKGVMAAAAVGLARHTLRATALLDPDPTVVMTQLNLALRHEQPTRMCTLAYMTLERQIGHFDMGVSLAGHPPPLVITSSGEVTPVGSPCPPLGLLASVEPVEESIKLLPGDTVLAYTDGFALRDQTPPETLIPLLEGAESEDLDPLLDRLLGVLRQSDDPVRDDVVLFALRVS